MLSIFLIASMVLSYNSSCFLSVWAAADDTPAAEEEMNRALRENGYADADAALLVDRDLTDDICNFVAYPRCLSVFFSEKHILFLRI